MKLKIIRRQSNADNSMFNERTYYTEDDNIILDFLNEYDGEGNISEWIEDNIEDMNVLHNDMSLGYNDKECDKVDYNIEFIADSGLDNVKLNISE